MRFSVYYLTFCFEVYNHHILKTKQQKIIQINFNPGLPLAGFRTILPGFQQVNMTWAHDPIENHYLASGQLQKTCDLDELHTWARNMATWYWSADTLFWQVSLIVTWMFNIKEVKQGYMSLSIYYLEYGRHHHRGRAYAPMSNTATASHDNHEKIHWWVSFSFPYEYGAPLGGPLGRRAPLWCLV